MVLDKGKQLCESLMQFSNQMSPQGKLRPHMSRCTKACHLGSDDPHMAKEALQSVLNTPAVNADQVSRVATPKFLADRSPPSPYQACKVICSEVE